jgi:hypothetical protein
MCTFGTGSSAVSGEGENLKNTLKNCAKTTAKINVQLASEFDEFQHVQRATWNFTRIVLVPHLESLRRAYGVMALPVPPGRPRLGRAWPTCVSTQR